MNLEKLIVAFVWPLIRSAVVPEVLSAITNLSDADVATAKKTLDTNVQSLHHVPGEIRRFIVSEIDGISAVSVDELKAALIAKVSSL